MEPSQANGKAPQYRRGRFGLLERSEGIITGTVVSASVIAAVGGTVGSTGQLTVALVATSFVYWLAHLHAHAIGESVKDQQHPWSAVRHAAAETWTILAATLLPLLILLLAELLGADLRNAALVALYATIVLLGVYSYLAGRRGGLGLRGSITSALAGAALGVLVAALKAFILH